MWAWAITIVESFSFAAHDELRASGLQRIVDPLVYQEIDLFYVGLRGLLHRVKQSSSKFDFLTGYGTDAKLVKESWDFVKELSNNTLMRGESALTVLEQDRLMREARSQNSAQ